MALDELDLLVEPDLLGRVDVLRGQMLLINRVQHVQPRVERIQAPLGVVLAPMVGMCGECVLEPLHVPVERREGRVHAPCGDAADHAL